MDTSTALRARHSTRQFSARAVDDAVLAAIVDDARHTPSWSNTQPWRIAVANGALCDAVRQDLVAAAQSRIPAPDVNQAFEYPPILQARRRATGFGLYAALGIAKDDKAARAQQFEKNFAMFDAPCAVFLYAHRALAHYAMLDVGCFLQSFLLAATARGVHTCAQAVLASFPDVVAAHFDLGDDAADWALVCGVAVGYESVDVVNRFQPPRLAASEFTIPPRR
jgi:nitroreductase